MSFNLPTNVNVARQNQQAQAAVSNATQDKINQLKALRAQLDGGQIGVSDFLKAGQPLAAQVNQELFSLAGQGSNNASLATKMLQDFQSNSGFKQSGDGNQSVAANLPAQYQQKLREELLPANLSPEERKALLNDIPTDIGFDTDRFKLEQEGVRQKMQGQQDQADAATIRSQRLKDLSTLMAQNDMRRFQQAVPGVAEDANAKGILRGTGFGEALASKANQLQADTDQALAQQGLTDRDAEANGVLSLGDSLRGFQTAGLQRQFSLSDFSKNKDFALQQAEAMQPKQQGKSNGEKWAQGLNAGASVVGAGSAAKKGK
jgi:hypothetical protein